MYLLAIVSIHVETGFNSCFPPESVANITDGVTSATNGAFTKTDNNSQLYKMFLEYS
jgi:hypothetical protein